MDKPATQNLSNPKAPPDTVAVVAPTSPPHVSTTVNAKIAPLLRDAVAGLHVADGAASYKASLVALRQTDGAPAALAQAFHATPAREYLQRWSVTTVLGDLHHPDALEPLRAIAVEPLPKATGEDAPQVLAEETMIRTAAVEGIARQAANPNAKALLFQVAQSPVFSVKRAAAQAYLAQGGARADLEKILPADQRFLLDIRAVSAADLPVFTPTAAAPRNPAREVPAPGSPGAPPVVAAPDASRSK